MAIVKEQDAKPLHAGHRQRLRDRLLNSPKGSLPDYEILEILLFASHLRADVKPLAKELIATFGSLANVLNASSESLSKIKGVNNSSLAQFKIVQEAAERLLKNEITNKPILNSWQALVDYCRASMGYIKTEQFRILFLNKKNILIADELQEVGTVDQTPVYPREIVKRALALEACALILVHNHPSGDTTPSMADINITNKIKHALQSVEITLHDHFIISQNGHYSFKTNRLI